MDTATLAPPPATTPAPRVRAPRPAPITVTANAAARIADLIAKAPEAAAGVRPTTRTGRVTRSTAVPMQPVSKSEARPTVSAAMAARGTAVRGNATRRIKP
jgi:hypothetical protein